MNNVRGVEALLFEYERISDTIMSMSQSVHLKLVAELGIKDKNSFKSKVYNEYVYSSNKYKNTDRLVSVNKNISSIYLKIEYPNPNIDSVIKKSSVLLPDYSIIGLRSIMSKFDEIAFNPYMRDKSGNLYLLENKTKRIVSRPNRNDKIEFTQDIYEDQEYGNDYGVRITLNDEFAIVVRTSTIWKSFYYYIMTCDLYTWGTALVNPYITKMVGNSITDFNSRSGEREHGYEPNRDDIAEARNSMNSRNKSKPITKEDKVKSFFDN